MFFFKKKKHPASESLPALSPAIRDSIARITGSNGIPLMPASAQQAFSVATDPSADLRDFVTVIEGDEGLAARVLKIANSVFFDRGKQSTTIEESVAVIGIGELRCLLNATSLSEIFPSPHPARTQLWAHDVATALISRSLAQRLLPAQSGAAFLAGLMHDIGKLLLLQRAAPQFSSVMEKVKREGCSFVSAEEELFVCNHCEVGQVIAERWNFSADLTGVIRLHHAPWSASPTRDIRSIVKAADVIAHALAAPGGSNPFRGQADDEQNRAWQVLGVGADERRDSLNGCRRVLETEFSFYGR